MHEMAIAQSAFEIVFREAEKHAGARIRKIKLSIGEFSGVVKDALDFAFEVLKTGTAAADAEIEIEVIRLSVECSKCGSVNCTISDLKLICERCERPLEIRAGREMKIDYIDLDDGE